MEHATWIQATAPAARPGPNANLPIARTLADFKAPACHQCTHNIHYFTDFRMIAHLYHDLYQEVLGWFCGLASELELAHSGAVPPANSP
jgi:hypothetical protein